MMKDECSLDVDSFDVEEGGAPILVSNGHGKFKAKSPDSPSHSSPSNNLFTSERSNMDYFTLAGVCKRTGATEDELAVFGLKENIDNALDFSEVNLPSYGENPEIFVEVKYNKERNYLVIRVRNSTFGLKNIGFTEERIHAIFDDLDRFHSSKRNLFKLSRGLQGDALKEEVGIPYALGTKYNGKEEGWNEPFIIRNGNGEEFEIRAVVNKIEGHNYCTIVKRTAVKNDDFTETETHLPYNDSIIDFSHIKQVLVKYALLNTHITFHFDVVTSITENDDKLWHVTLPATQKLSISNNNSNRLTSIYWTDLSTFENLIYGIEDKSMVLYDILVNHFKEGSSLKKEDDLLVSVEELQRLPKQESEEKIRDIFLRLRDTMGPTH